MKKGAADLDSGPVNKRWANSRCSKRGCPTFARRSITRRQHYCEQCPLAWLAGGFDFAAVHFHESFHEAQSQAQAAPAELELARGMTGHVEGSEERLEKVR